METFLPVFLFYAPRNYVMILIKTDLTIRQLIVQRCDVKR